MNPFKGIFGGKIDAASTADNLLGKLDDSKLTKEEAIKHEQLKADAHAAFVSKTADENTIRSKSRRFATYLVLVNFFIAFWMVVALYFFDYKEAAIFVKDLAVEWKLVAAFFAVILFFFSGYYVMQSIEKAKKK